MPNPNSNLFSQQLHIAWNGIPFTLLECQIACALSIYITFEDGTPIDDKTIGEVLGSNSGLQPMNCNGLVAHLKETNDVYPTALNGGQEWADWVRNIYNQWLDPMAAAVGQWP